MDSQNLNNKIIIKQMVIGSMQLLRRINLN